MPALRPFWVGMWGAWQPGGEMKLFKMTLRMMIPAATNITNLAESGIIPKFAL